MGAESHLGVGIFPIVSRLNHSCTPNVQHSYNATIGREVVHAIRDIQKDEEIVTSYVPLQRPASTRDEDLAKKWGFECKCDICSGSDRAKSDIRRQRLYEIDQGFAFLDKPIDQRIYMTAFVHGMVPKTESMALLWAEESVVLLTIEGLVGMDMAKA